MTILENNEGIALEHQLIKMNPQQTSVEMPSAPKQLRSNLRKCELPIPPVLNEATGIDVFGRTVKSFVYSTDPYIIRNCNADAVLALAPFTCQSIITEMLIKLSERPVFVGVAGAITNGLRSVELARIAEAQGAAGVCVSPGADVFTVESIANSVDIPVVVSVAGYDQFSQEKIAAGASMINVVAGRNTAEVTRLYRESNQDMIILATAGKTSESALTTIGSGADALSWTPPSIVEIERQLMQNTRDKQSALEVLEANF